MNEVSHQLLRVRSDVMFGVGLVLAILVTLHVLLRKREVASAVGWIGLAWFAPVSGAIAYALLGVNRVQRRAREARPQDSRRSSRSSVASPGDDGHLDGLARGVGRITGRPIVPGNGIAMYQNGDEAYPPMLEAIGGARASVGLSTYIFRDDRWGGRFIEALIAAHGRGVAVRVLIDGIGGGWLGSPAYHRLHRAKVPAARFMHSPLPWRMPFLNLRSHKKVLVIDGAVGFTGGMNIADENVMAAAPKTPVQDTHFRIAGPVVCQLVEAFVQDWSFAAGEELDGDAWFPEIQDAGGAPARVIDSGPDEDIEKVEFAVLQAISCARERIALMSPYFLPDDRLISALVLAVMRGVAVDVVVPSKTNHFYVDCATRANVGPLLKEGVRIWRCPPPFRHSKVMLVDDEWCLVGSANWDIRSFRLNFELCVELYDRDLAGTLSAFMEGSRGPALTLAELDGRSLPARLRDAAVRLAMPYL